MSLMLRHNSACVTELFASSANHDLSEEEQRDKWDALVVRRDPWVVWRALCVAPNPGRHCISTSTRAHV